MSSKDYTTKKKPPKKIYDTVIKYLSDKEKVNIKDLNYIGYQGNPMRDKQSIIMFNIMDKKHSNYGSTIAATLTNWEWGDSVPNIVKIKH